MLSAFLFSETLTPTSILVSSGELPLCMPNYVSTASNDGLLTRVSLLQRAKDDTSPAAWRELLGYYEPFVSKVLLGMGFRGADLDDVRQLVSLRLWNGLRRYERDVERAMFRTWFARLIRNTASNFLRSKRRQPSGPSMDDEGVDLAIPLSEQSAIDARVEEEWQEYIVGLALERASAAFSGNAIEVFTRSMSGESVEAIAAHFKIKPNTIYILRHRVKAVLLREIRQLKRDLEIFGDKSSS